MRKLLLSISILLLSFLSLQAIPAYPGPVERIQPDGTIVHILLQGDEHCHLLTTLDRHPLLEDDEGWLRYASLIDGDVTCLASSPVAHDAEMRTADEIQFLDQHPAFDLYDITTGPNRAPQVSTEPGDMQIGTFPTRGKVRGLIILAEYTDVKFSTDAEYFERIMNEDGCTLATPFGSAVDYFRTQSMGLFDPTFDVVGPVALDTTMAYYGKNSGRQGDDMRAGQMIRDACQKADTILDVDFSQYDYDDDGKVDMVFVIYAGYGENYGASSNCIWPHKYELSNYGIKLTLDDKAIDVYACTCEIYGNKGTVPGGIGTFCHEFGHVMGLADHYSTTNSSRMMTGRYDIMDMGCYNDSTYTPPAYTALERYSLGWMDLEEIKEPAFSLSLEDIEVSNQAYLLQTPRDNEFFILETRVQNGWDTYIPSQGMMITHVDYLKLAWELNIVNIAANPRYCIVPADNSRSYNNDNRDLYPLAGRIPSDPGNNAFTGNTTPASITWDKQWIDCDITNIQFGADSIVTFDFRTEPVGTPTALEASDLYSNAFTAHWTEAERAASYSLNVFRYDTIVTNSETPDSLFERVLLEKISDITETSYTLKDLDTDHRYGYTIIAWDGRAHSEESNEVQVELLNSMPPMGIEQIHADEATLPSRSSILYNLQGQKISHPKAGQLYIRNGKKIIL